MHIVLRSAALLGAILLILLPALLDVEAIGALSEPFQNTVDAVFSLIGIFVTAQLVNSWQKERANTREKERFSGLSTIAFRSLSQTVNDVGRSLLAPTIGADLYSAGIPGAREGDCKHDRRILARNHFSPLDPPSSGFWLIDNAELERVAVLCDDSDYVDRMFRVTSGARRALQRALADWAPVMVSVPEANERLSGGWALADSLVTLAEHWRALQVTTEGGAPRALHIAATKTVYLATVELYRAWLEELQPDARLPTRGVVLAA